MRFRRRRLDQPQRRAPRPEAFRSRALVNAIRPELATWLCAEGFKRLGDRGWIRSQGDIHVLVCIQCRQSGWDPRAGGRFVVELEQSRKPELSTGFNRDRIWALLPPDDRRAAIEIVDEVAATLPEPDDHFLRTLPPDVSEHYLLQFSPTTWTTEDSALWFNYYDESDVVRWGEFLGRTLGPALEKLLHRPPSFMGIRPEAPG